MASHLIAMASNLLAMASLIIAMSSNLLAMASHLIARFHSHAHDAREIDWMEVWTQTSVPARMKTFAHAVTPLFLLLFPRWLFVRYPPKQVSLALVKC